MKNIYKHSEENEIIINIDLNGLDTECVLINILHSEYADNKYAVLLPKNEEFIKDKNILLYKMEEQEENKILNLIEIFNDEEYEYVMELLNESLLNRPYYDLLNKYGYHDKK